MPTSIPHWIDGARREGAGDRTAPVTDPATGEVTGAVALATPEEVDAAVAAATAAFPAWRDTSLTKRTAVLFRFRELLNAKKPELAAIITAEHGKVLDVEDLAVLRGDDRGELRLLGVEQLPEPEEHGGALGERGVAPGGEGGGGRGDGGVDLVGCGQGDRAGHLAGGGVGDGGGPVAGALTPGAVDPVRDGRGHGCLSGDQGVITSGTAGIVVRSAAPTRCGAGRSPASGCRSRRCSGACARRWGAAGRVGRDTCRARRSRTRRGPAPRWPRRAVGRPVRRSAVRSSPPSAPPRARRRPRLARGR